MGFMPREKSVGHVERPSPTLPGFPHTEMRRSTPFLNMTPVELLSKITNPLDPVSVYERPEDVAQLHTVPPVFPDRISTRSVVFSVAQTFPSDGGNKVDQREDSHSISTMGRGAVGSTGLFSILAEICTLHPECRYAVEQPALELDDLSRSSQTRSRSRSRDQ